MESNNKLVLGYWPIRGQAEKIRLLLQFTGFKYEQVFYYEDNEDQWFKVEKPKLRLKNPAINLPYLIDGDKVISESTAIIIYICHKAKRLDLLGRKADEQVQLATAFGVYKDFQPQLSNLAYTPEYNYSWEESLKAFCENSVQYLQKFSGILGTKNYICGEITWIDFVLADTFQVLRLMNPSIFDNFANLKDLQERIWGLSELKDYFANRWLQHPVNGQEARWT